MGGVGEALVPVAEQAGKEFLDEFGGNLSKRAFHDSQAYYRSMRAILDKTELGKQFGDYLEYHFEPMFKKEAQGLVDKHTKLGKAPDIAYKDAAKEAFANTRKALMGKNDEVPIKIIAAETRTHGPARGNLVADSMSVYFHDAASRWRRTSIKLGPGPDAPKLNLKDLGILADAPYQNPTQLENYLKQKISWMYTAQIAIPQLGKIGNIVLNEGLKSATKAAFDLAGYYAKMGTPEARGLFLKNIMDSGVLFDELRYQMIEDAQGGGIIRKLYHHPFFGLVRRTELSLSAIAGRHTVEDAAEKLRMKPNDQWSLFQLRNHGINPEDLAKREFKLTDQEIQKAMYTAGNKAIFIKSPLYNPPAWEQAPWSRMAMQFKHFGFRQGAFLFQKLFKDAYASGGAPGVAKAIAVWGAMFYPMGELIHSLENATVGKNPLDRKDNPFDKRWQNNPTAETFYALGVAGGLGMFYSMIRGSLWNLGKGFLTGPLFSTLEDLTLGLGTHVVKGGVYYAEGKKEQALEEGLDALTTIVGKFGLPGRAAAEQTRQYRASRRKRGIGR